MNMTTHVHLYEEDKITSSIDKEHNICWLSLASNLNISIKNSEMRDEIIKHLMFMEFENEND